MYITLYNKMLHSQEPSSWNSIHDVQSLYPHPLQKNEKNFTGFLLTTDIAQTKNKEIWKAILLTVFDGVPILAPVTAGWLRISDADIELYDWPWCAARKQNLYFTYKYIHSLLLTTWLSPNIQYLPHENQYLNIKSDLCNCKNTKTLVWRCLNLTNHKSLKCMVTVICLFHTSVSYKDTVLTLHGSK